ncbi:putative methyltransferase chromatin remodeling SET family [Medicago truncatula]|uniref:Putative methyltransferase chromatin remodeling SET family n=1 Tax=Medicago truncatula TaxID=3880 RepID=A0A396JAS6_MEDTR|nr:putative methyltransferase chromatin remodeling SET family [Medicago truncatula]
MDADHRSYREMVRRTRILFDSIRVSGLLEEENNRKIKKYLKASSLINQTEEVNNCRVRNDLIAATLMNDHGMYLYHDVKIAGPVPGVCVGDIFLYRSEMCVIGLHGQPQAGIDYLHASMSSNGQPIATSVVVSDGYNDDDQGEFIIYSGHGDMKQDQKLERGNLAMVTSMQYEIDVRVIRGFRLKIIDCWFEKGISGFGVYKFMLSRVEGQPKMGSMILKEAGMLKRGQLCDILCMSFMMIFPMGRRILVMTTKKKMRAIECSECVDGCVSSIINGNTTPYSKSGILLKGMSLIYECGPFCSCPLHCRNRVTQKGIKYRLEVFRSNETSWGVRSLDPILAGTFICEFTRLVLTREQAEILTMDGEHNSLTIYPNRFLNRSTQEWGDLSMIDANHVHPAYPTLHFALDVSMMRNVASYISHSPTPNVFVQLVLFDNGNWMFPHLMVFAMENIPPMRELSLDHGVEAG